MSQVTGLDNAKLAQRPVPLAPGPAPRIPTLATHAPSPDIRRSLETLQGQYAVVVDMNVFESLAKEQREEFYKLFPIYDADREEERKVKFIFSATGDRRLSPVMQEIMDFQKEYPHHVELRVDTPPAKFGTRKIIHVTKDDIQNLSTAGFEDAWRKSGKLFEIRYRANNQKSGLLTAALLLLDSGREELFRTHSYLSEIPAGWVSAIQSFLKTYFYLGRSA
jgi:hypothetical protein